MSIQTDATQAARATWINNGRPHCDHLEVEKEYYLGTATGDYACTSCDETWWGRYNVILMRRSQTINEGLHKDCKHSRYLYGNGVSSCLDCGLELKK
jgi:hypothetical protein